MNGFDFAALDTVRASDEGRAMVVRNPITAEALKDGNGENVTITLAGPDSHVVKSFERELITKRLADKEAKIDPDRLESEKIDLLARCTLSWSGIMLDGQPIECNRENATMMYRRFPWLAEQANAFVGKRANFLPNSQNKQ